MSYIQLQPQERECFMNELRKGTSMRDIAKILGRHHTTLSRELKRNRSLPWNYSAYDAGKRASKERRKKKKHSKIIDNAELQTIIQTKLALRWSPETIANYLKRTYPEDTTMQISHESIYTYIYVLPRGELRKELISYLRQKHGRQRRKRGTDQRGTIPNMISIHERPPEVAHRTVPGHWESDLIIGKNHQSAIGTLVERTTRTTIIVPLKHKDAQSVRKAFANVVQKLPKEVCKSITHDRGTEMSEHELFTKQTHVQVYFADPQSPWQRGTNENTNGLIRQFFPKGTDFNEVTKKELRYVQKLLNERPRKVLGYRTPKEVFEELLVNGAVDV
jgi:transposase, IS30 family